MSWQNFDESRRAEGVLGPTTGMHDKNRGRHRGGKGEDTCDHGLFFRRPFVEGEKKLPRVEMQSTSYYKKKANNNNRHEILHSEVLFF